MAAGGFTLSFEVDISSLSSELPKWAADRIPSITRNALNDTIEEARFAEMDRIRGVFDRPTPYVQRSPLFAEATKENLVAEVFIRHDSSRGGTPPAKILAAEVMGGARRAKAFELLLRRAGIMAGNEFAVPGRDTPADVHGNVPRSLITRIIAGVGRGAVQRATGRRRRRASRFFVPAPGSRLRRGVWEQIGPRQVRPALLFVTDVPDYQKRYDFGRATITLAERVFPAYWQRHFYAELAKHQSR